MKRATNLLNVATKSRNFGKIRQFSSDPVKASGNLAMEPKKTHFGFTDIDESEKENGISRKEFRNELLKFSTIVLHFWINLKLFKLQDYLIQGTLTSSTYGRMKFLETEVPEALQNQ